MMNKTNCTVKNPFSPIDDKLSWDYQIEHIKNKLLSTIVLIKRIKKFIPRPNYMKIHYSYYT